MPSFTIRNWEASSAGGEGDGEEGGGARVGAAGGEKNQRRMRTLPLLFLWDTMQDRVTLSFSVTITTGPGVTVTLRPWQTSVYKRHKQDTYVKSSFFVVAYFNTLLVTFVYASLLNGVFILFVAIHVLFYDRIKSNQTIKHMLFQTLGHSVGLHCDLVALVTAPC